MKKNSLIIASSLIIISGSPVLASTQPTSTENSGGVGIVNQLFGGNLYNQAQGIAGNFGINLDSYLNSMTSFLTEEIGGALNLNENETNLIFSVLSRGMLEKIQERIGDIFGAFGYPSPDEINREIPEIIINDDQEEIGEFTILAKAEAEVFASRKKITDAYLESRLGKEAQQQKKQQLDSITSLADSSVNSATDAASQNVTQDVLKQVAVQNANQALISSAMFGELTQLGFNQSMSFQELSKISTNLEEEDWQEKVNSAANRVSVVEAITQFGSLF